MDFSILMVTILISAVCGKQGQLVKVKACQTEVPKKLKCTALQVEHGTACYKDDKAVTSVSCNEQYSFNTETVFKCKEIKGQTPKTGTWSPTDTAKCSYTETTTCVTSMSSTCTTSMPNTPDFTTIDTSSSVKLYSTTHEIQTDKTESLFTTSFESILLPSESTMFSTPVISATLSMTTPILQSDIVTGIPTISVTETVNSNSVSALTQPVPAVSKEVKGSDITAVYITVPVVVCIIAIIVGIIFLFCRQRRRKSVQTVLKRGKGPSSSITNKAYENTMMERHCSLINVRKSRDSGYAEIPSDFLHPDEASGSVYQTIDSLPEDQIESSTTYGHLKQQTTKLTDRNYSHTNINKTAEQSVTDTFYDHTEKADVSNQSKDSIEDGGATYNRLNISPCSMTVIEDLDKADDDTEPEYDHAKAGGTDQENKADTYSHLNGSSQTPQTFARHEKYQYHNKDNRTKLPDIQPYEFVKEPESPGYEFANDVDNPNSESISTNVTDTSVKQEYRELKQECVGNQGYETAVGNSNTYFILEPEEGPGSNDVVGDFSYEKLDLTNNAESVNHQYFTLEKTDT